jgi:hypothetical protein
VVFMGIFHPCWFARSNMSTSLALSGSLFTCGAQYWTLVHSLWLGLVPCVLFEVLHHEAFLGVRTNDCRRVGRGTHIIELASARSGNTLYVERPFVMRMRSSCFAARSAFFFGICVRTKSPCRMVAAEAFRYSSCRCLYLA